MRTHLWKKSGVIMNLLHSTGQALTPNYPWHFRKPRGNLPPLLARARPRLVLLLTALFTSALFFPQSAIRNPQSAFVWVGEAHASDVQYVYDDLGRLSAVVDSATNEAALYHSPFAHFENNF